jgi:hypothetical protein
VYEPKLGGGVTPLLLDTYSGASAAYSLRKLRTAYTGYAIRVRRSSDNTSQDIGFDANGNLDTVSLLSFVGAGNGFVSIWYDQSGNSKNIIQNTSVYQPKIVNSGSILTKNNKVGLYFDSNQFLRGDYKVIGNSGVSVFNVFAIQSVNQRSIGWDIGNNAFYEFYAFDVNTYNTPTQSFGFYGNLYPANSSQSTNINQNLLSIVSNTTVGLPIEANTFYHINNSLKTLSPTYANGNMPNYSSASRITLGKFNSLGVDYSGFGYHQEMVIFDTNRMSDLSGINTNINSYYSIY